MRFTTPISGQARGLRPGGAAPVVLGVLVLALAAIGAGLLVFLDDDAFAELEPLPASAILDDPERLVGNTYLLRARIVEQLPGYKEGVGRLVSVRPADDANEVAPFAVFVPDTIDANIEVEQRYRMEVFMQEDALLRVERMEKY
ncbi:MAG: hypothetical protein ACFB20_02735 [Opitutales bacterium]